MEIEIRKQDGQCKKCGCGTGVVEEKNGQDVVRCSRCNSYLYCQPKTESGKLKRSVSTTHSAISPKQRMRIFQRAGGSCEICGRRGSVMHVGHVVSVADGHALGMCDDEINHDENLICSCEECNLGLGRETVSLKLAIKIIRARIAK